MVGCMSFRDKDEKEKGGRGNEFLLGVGEAMGQCGGEAGGGEARGEEGGRERDV